MVHVGKGSPFRVYAQTSEQGLTLVIEHWPELLRLDEHVRGEAREVVSRMDFDRAESAAQVLLKIFLPCFLCR